MQNNDEIPLEGKVDKTSIQKKQQLSTIFTPEETVSVVKGFILAWLKGKVQIRFSTAEQIINRLEMEGEAISRKEANEREVRGKMTFIDLILICAGYKSVTPEEIQKSNAALFGRILGFRAGERIEGDFFEYSIQERLSRLERGLEVTNNLVQELMDFHRGELGLC